MPFPGRGGGGGGGRGCEPSGCWEMLRVNKFSLEVNDLREFIIKLSAGGDDTLPVALHKTLRDACPALRTGRAEMPCGFNLYDSIVN